MDEIVFNSIPGRESSGEDKTGLDASPDNPMSSGNQSGFDAGNSQPEEKLRAAVSRLQNANQRLGDLNRQLASMNVWPAAANERMLDILDQLQVGAIVADANGHIIFISRVAERLLNRQDSDALGRHWRDSFSIQENEKARLAAMLELPQEQRGKSRFAGTRARRVASGWKSKPKTTRGIPQTGYF